MTFPDNISARESYILNAVKAGDFWHSWLTISYSEKGHTVDLDIQADALMVEGVRVNVSARLSQQIADVTGAMLMTPKIADIVYNATTLRIGPQPRPITSATSAMIDHSKKVEAALSKLPGYTPGQLVDTVGKYWCVSNELKGTTTKALNYGWHFTGSSYQGINGYPCDSKMPYKVIQPSATAHDYAHVDYSQIHRTVGIVCTVDGQRMALADLLVHPDLCYLVSHEGPLAVLRQPGVPNTSDGMIVGPKPVANA